jgi:hypothetical protein
LKHRPFWKSLVIAALLASDMSCSDENLASLLMALSESRQVVEIVGETLERKLQPWLISSQKCVEMLQSRLTHACSETRFIESEPFCLRFVAASASELSYGDVLVVKRALCRSPPPPTPLNTSPPAPSHHRYSHVLNSRIMFGDLEGMPVLLPLDSVSPASNKSSAHVLDIFRQASLPPIAFIVAANELTAAICIRSLHSACQRPCVS